LGARAGEVIHEVQLGKYYNIKFAKFYNVIHAYPTYSELVWHAARMAYVEGLKNHPVVKIANKISGLFRSKKK